MIQGANIAPDHVDRDADAIEHLLTPELIAQLEAGVAAPIPGPDRPDAVPRSPHETSPPTGSREEPRV